MNTIKSFEEGLYGVNASTFPDIALSLFHFQAEANPVYRDYLSHLRIKPSDVGALHEIPFLPISFFKSHDIKTGQWLAETIFKSSGTTGQQTSSHAVKELSFYLRNSQRIFEQFYGPLFNYHILALLPSYLEREGSSLIAMMKQFIDKSGSPHSGFYLNNNDVLVEKLQTLRAGTRKILLWGVSFGLLDLAEKFEVDLSGAVVMETGGMKGRRAEITRQELHDFLKKRLNVPEIHSEYGMTELLSQGYAKSAGLFNFPPWVQPVIRELNDPFCLQREGKAGGINMIDLANFNSCAFVETQDLGIYTSHGLEILGRIDNSDVRGCNLLVG
ncbi:MAG: acyl transferase [Cytophagales bacterium]|nr:acyl transferase [Cytophagales bacterium]